MRRSIAISGRALLACGVIGVWAGTPAQASPLATGATLYPAPAEIDPLGGTVVASMTQAFGSPTFKGTLTSSVIAGDVTNLLGGLTFTFLLHNDASSAHPLARLTVNGYDGFVTDASYNPLGVGQAPTLINRPESDYVGFSFMEFVGPGDINPGTSTLLLVIQTNAPTYTEDYASVIDGFVASTPYIRPPAGAGHAGAGGHRRDDDAAKTTGGVSPN